MTVSKPLVVDCECAVVRLDACANTERGSVVCSDTNEVKKASGGPEFSTAFCDVYVGRLVNRTVCTFRACYRAYSLMIVQVALTFPRLLNSSPAAQRSLRKHLDTWGCLDHPNVLKVEGTAVIDGCVYLVCCVC